MKLFQRNTVILLLLISVFSTPGILAYWVYRHPHWFYDNSTNKGVLIRPAVLFPHFQSNSKWKLVLWSFQDCKKVCFKQLDQLARVRLALGRRLYKVELWLILGNSTRKLPDAVVHDLNDEDIHVLQLKRNEPQELRLLTEKCKIILVDPEQYIVMSYPDGAKPGDIFYDLKHLIGT